MKILYMIRIPSLNDGAVLAAGLMEESKNCYRVPKDERGIKDYSLSSVFWNADWLKKGEEYELHNSTAGLYMWGEDKSKLFSCWMKAMSPQSSSAFNEKVAALQAKLEPTQEPAGDTQSDAQNQLLVMSNEYINVGLRLFLEGSLEISTPDANTVVECIGKMICESGETRFTAYDYIDAIINWKDPIDIKRLLALDDSDLGLAMVAMAEYKRNVYSYDSPDVGDEGLAIVDKVVADKVVEK